MLNLADSDAHLLVVSVVSVLFLLEVPAKRHSILIRVLAI